MPSTRTRRRALAALVTSAAVAVATLTGCSAGSRDTSSGGAPAARPGQQEAAPAGAAPEAADKDGAPAAGRPAPAKFAPEERAIVYTGSITVRVSNVDEAAAKATALATGAGGFVGEDRRTNDGRRSEARVTLRVPAKRFTEAVDGIGRLGKEEARGISTEDVTAQVVDLDARIATAQASVERVRALLARAQNIGEIVSLEGEVSRREAELESLQARKRRLADLTALSTITAVLLAPDAAGKEDEPETGFLVGLKAGWSAFLTSMQVLLTILGALLPWLVALALPVLLLVWLLRRRRPLVAPGVPAAATPLGGMAATPPGGMAATPPGGTAATPLGGEVPAGPGRPGSSGPGR